MNCLPVWPLDGARLAEALARPLGLGTAVRRGMLWLAYLLAAALLAAGLYGVFRGSVNVTLFLLPPYLCYAAWQSSVGGSLRSAEAALRTPGMTEGQLREARVFAAGDRPGRVALLRLLRAQPLNREIILYRFDKNGRASPEILSRQGLTELLTEENGGESFL